MPVLDAAPYRYEFVPEATALVLIDMQRDFIEPGGFGSTLGNDVSRLAAIIPATARLLAGCRAAGLAIVHTREAHRPDLSDCPPSKRLRGNAGLRIGDPGPMGRILIAGEPGADIVADLAPRPGEIVIDKPGKGAFYATALQQILSERGVTHLLFGGVTTEVCVQTTMREANDRGYECLLVEDATESYFPEFKEAAIAMIRAQGAIVGWTATSDQVLAALEAAAWDLPFALPELWAIGHDPDRIEWEPFRPGLTAHWLYRSGADGPSAALLRYAPGAAVPRHLHPGFEHVLVLAGAQSDERGRYPAGTLSINPPGSRHSVWSDEGCVVLLVWEKPVVIEG